MYFVCVTVKKFTFHYFFNAKMTWRNTHFEYGLEPSDKKNITDNIVDLNKFTNKVLTASNETMFLNENKARLWFWKNVMFIFSTGTIFNKLDSIQLQTYLSYFSKDETCYLPNIVKIYNFESPEIKQFEKEFNIGNGNYHVMLIPFVLDGSSVSVDGSIVAPEQGYERFGPVDVFITPEEITNYLQEVNYKYGCVRRSVPDSIKEGIFGQARKMPTGDGVPGVVEEIGLSKRIHKKGYIDLINNGKDELVSPEQNLFRYAPQRNYYETSDSDKLVDSETAKVVYRGSNKTISREKNVDDGRTWQGKRQNRQQQKDSLYNKLLDTRRYVQTTMIMPHGKGAMLKMNNYYETEHNKTEKPNYEIYEGGDQWDQVNGRDEMPVIRVSNYSDGEEKWRPKKFMLP